MKISNSDALLLEDLVSKFGLELRQSTGTFSVKPPTPNELRATVDRWFDQNRFKIREAIRSNPAIHRLAYGKKQRDGQAIAALVLDALSSSITGVPLSTAALIIAYYYLDHYLTDDIDKSTASTDGTDAIDKATVSTDGKDIKDERENTGKGTDSSLR
jgi:hypothetical protein